MNEAEITINGVGLTDAQAMILRVACVAFDNTLQESDALGDDAYAQRMTAAYRALLSGIIPLLLSSQLKGEGA